MKTNLNKKKNSKNKSSDRSMEWKLNFLPCQKIDIQAKSLGSLTSKFQLEISLLLYVNSQIHVQILINLPQTRIEALNMKHSNTNKNTKLEKKENSQLHSNTLHPSKSWFYEYYIIYIILYNIIYYSHQNSGNNVRPILSKSRFIKLFVRFRIKKI